MRTLTISGHTDLPIALFDKYYKAIITSWPGRFVFGCATGADEHAINLVKSIDPSRMTVYNRSGKPRPDFVTNEIAYDDSSASWTERDDLLRSISDETISFVYGTKMGLGSGSARNIVAREMGNADGFYEFTRAPETTVEMILERYPVLRDKIIIQPNK